MLTFGFGFPLRSRSLALRTDLCEPGQVGLSFVSLTLSMQLVKWASAVRGRRAGAGPKAEANTKCQNEIETGKSRPASKRAHLLSNNVPWPPSSPSARCAQNVIKKGDVVRTKSAGIRGHGCWHIPLSARQLAGRAQIRDVELLGNVVRVGDQVFAIIAVAIIAIVCALALSSLVRPLISLFLLELSAFCAREFHGRRVFPLLFLFLFFVLVLFLVLFLVGIIVRGVTRSTGRKKSFVQDGKRC